MALRIELHPQAEFEFWEAVDWYDEQSEGLGRTFARAFEEVVVAISQRPMSFPLEYNRKRKAVVQRFPYIVIFEIYTDYILILSVFHTKRDPSEWQER
jgi:plasmid stabilization system protein ParE